MINMCGICGFAGFEDKDLIKRMTKIIEHRGPDDEGYFIDRKISLGMKRLSIIDLKTGKQPIHNEDGTIWIVYNGEVYNFLELREELERKGHKFYTNTDTEVIVHAYEEYGVDCVKKFNGQFAFAIWDSVKKQLMLARDRLGIKPVYFTQLNGKFLFASEIKSILEYNDVKREVNMEAMNLFLTLRYVPGDKTLFKNIIKLMPGHILLLKDGGVSIQKYWDLEINPENRPAEYFEKELLRLLKESIKRRLISDVPLGVALSGGLDSSSILSLMKDVTDEPIKAFSIGFGEESGVDELNYAEKVAEHFNVEHKCFTADSSVVNLLPKLVWHMDEPVADVSMIPVYMLYNLSKKHVKVLLVGDGADEIFAGYVQHRIMTLGGYYKNGVPSVLKKNVVRPILNLTPDKILNKIVDYPSSLGVEVKNRMNYYLDNFDSDERMYLSTISLFNEKNKDNLLTDKFREKMKALNLNFEKGEDILGKMLYYDIKQWLPNYILLMGDRTSMANSLEARVPFLDHELVEFSGKIPSNLKLSGLNPKFIIKKVMRNKLPEFVVKRKKQPFFLPGEMLFNDEFLSVLNETFSDRNIEKRGYFKNDFIRKLINNFEKSKLIYTKQIFSLYLLELWHKIYIDGEKL